jgi:hypothetical protein
MLASALQDKLYLASSVEPLGPATTKVHCFTITPGTCPGLSYDASVEIAQPTQEVLNFTATSTAGSADIALTWENPTAPDFQKVTILRKTGAGAWPTGPTDPGAVTVYDQFGTSYVDNTMAASETTYSYRAYANYDDGMNPAEYSEGVYAQATAMGTAGSSSGSGPVTAITAIAEDRQTGRLYVTGYAAPAFAPDHPLSDPVFCRSCPAGQRVLFARPTLASWQAWPPSSPPIPADAIDCFDLALPISAAFVPPPPPEHVPPDFDLDGDVDLEDYGHLQVCLTGAGVSVTDPACSDASLDGDDDVDSEDLLMFTGCLNGADINPDSQCMQ